MCQGVADIAQSVERILGKDEVPSSNLGISSRKTVYFMCAVFFFPIIFPIIEEEKSGNREIGKVIIMICQFYIKIINRNIIKNKALITIISFYAIYIISK